MVKENGILPIDFRMAAFTHRSKRTLMSIVFRMAGVAGCRQCYIEDGLDMTIRTGYFAVTAE